MSEQQQQPQAPLSKDEYPKSVKFLTGTSYLAKEIIKIIDETFLRLNQTPCGEVEINDITGDSSISIISNKKQFKKGYTCPEWNVVIMGKDEIGEPILQRPKTGPHKYCEIPLVVGSRRGLAIKIDSKVKDPIYPWDTIIEVKENMNAISRAILVTDAESKKEYKRANIKHENFDLVWYTFTLDINRDDEEKQYGHITYIPYSSEAVPETPTQDEKIEDK